MRRDKKGSQNERTKDYNSMAQKNDSIRGKRTIILSTRIEEMVIGLRTIRNFKKLVTIGETQWIMN